MRACRETLHLLTKKINLWKHKCCMDTQKNISLKVIGYDKEIKQEG